MYEALSSNPTPSGTGFKQRVAGALLVPPSLAACNDTRNANLSPQVVSAALAVVAVFASQRLQQEADDYASAYSRVDSAAAAGYAAFVDSRDSPLTLQVDVYLWNLTNPEAVLAGDAAPALQQVGPFSFEERVVRTDIEWEAPGADVVRYRTLHALSPLPAAPWGAAPPSAAETDGNTSCYADIGPPLPVPSSPASVRVAAAPHAVSGASAATAGVATRAFVAATAAAASRLVAAVVGPRGAGAGDGASAQRPPDYDPGGGGDAGSDAASVHACRAASPLRPVLPPLGLDAPLVSVYMPPFIFNPNVHNLTAELRAGAAAAMGGVRGALGGGALRAAPPLIVRTARELLFGYDDPLMRFLHDHIAGSVPERYLGLLPNASFIWPPPPPPTAGADAGGFDRMFTGAAGGTSYRARQLLSWDDMETLYCCVAGPCGSAGPAGEGAHPAWADEQANRVAGFEPWQLRGGLAPGDTAPVWLRQLYRGVQVVNAPGWGAGGGPAGSAARKGVAGLRFTLDPTLLLPSGEYAGNAAFWQVGTPPGVANVSNCAGSQPLFVTKPLFLAGNASLREAVDGVPPPMPILHDTWYDVEPETGAALAVRERMQLNALADLGPARRLFLPLLWYDKHGQICDAGAAAFRAATVDKRNAASKLLLTLSVVAALTGAVGIVMAVAGVRRGRTERLERLEAGMGRLLVDTTAESQTRKALLEAFHEENASGAAAAAVVAGDGGGASGSGGGGVVPVPFMERHQHAAGLGSAAGDTAAAGGGAAGTTPAGGAPPATGGEASGAAAGRPHQRRPPPTPPLPLPPAAYAAPDGGSVPPVPTAAVRAGAAAGFVGRTASAVTQASSRVSADFVDDVAGTADGPSSPTSGAGGRRTHSSRSASLRSSVSGGGGGGDAGAGGDGGGGGGGRRHRRRGGGGRGGDGVGGDFAGGHDEAAAILEPVAPPQQQVWDAGRLPPYMARLLRRPPAQQQPIPYDAPAPPDDAFL